MKVIEVQFNPWDKVYHFDPKESDYQAGDLVVVKTELGLEVGKVLGQKEMTQKELAVFSELKPILRRANSEDLEKLKEKEGHKKEAIESCKRLIKKHNLPMKLIDVHFSFDGGRVTFAFIAEGRVDFRELVKDLTRKFQKSIRLQQLGVRDAAKFEGDVGGCGRNLCCQRFLKELGNITSNLAEDQQVAHRGPERLSGMCGRLMCCLDYEESTYKKLIANLPAIGSQIKTPRGRGRVVGWHTLKQTVDIVLEGEEKTVVEIPVKTNN